MSLHSNNTLDAEFSLHATTRQENNSRLRPQIEQLRNGQAIAALEPFAKAYLGLYLDIDSSFAPYDRIRFLVDDDIAEAVVQGFVKILYEYPFPRPEEIGEKMARGERDEIGYIVLAGMDHLMRQSQLQSDSQALLYKLPAATIDCAVCFHYANACSFRNEWLEPLLKDKSDALAPVLEAFWLGLIKQGTGYIPGLHDYLDDKQTNQAHISQVLLPILKNWSGYKKKFLNELLQTAIRYTDKQKLAAVTDAILTRDDPGLTPNKRILWLATAFVLQPDNYWQDLLDYTQRSKEKILPLLDFTVELASDIRFDAYVLPHFTLARLLRIIAPRFPPHYDSFDNLTENAKKTLRLFYIYAGSSHDISESLEWLQQVRVMKIVKSLLTEVMQFNQQLQHNETEEMPSFNEFMSSLKKSGKLQGRQVRYK